MPEKTKDYERVIFTPEAIKEAVDTLMVALKGKKKKLQSYQLMIKTPHEEWHYDTEEEFFADYRRGFEDAHFEKYSYYGESGIEFWIYGVQYRGKIHTEVSVRMPTRADVEKVFGVLESNMEKYRIPEPPPGKRQIKVFIGHGRNTQWRDLKDHLHDKHRLDVEAYEIGARAGLTIKEVLDDMLTSSSFALLVFTGEDLDAKGGLHARENVIHELGLFQGRLGWQKAIALLEDGVSEFSNIQGLIQIRFSKGNIKETFGEVLATIKREFPDIE